MTTKRQIVRATNKIVGNEFQKESRSFIADTFRGDFIQPSFTNISDADAWMFYDKNDWTGNVIDRIVSDCVKHPITIVPIDKSKKVKKGSRIARRIKSAQNFFDDPNGSKEGMSDIREKLLRDLLVIGRGAIEKVVDEETRKVQELWSVSAQDIRIQADDRGNIPATDAYRLKPPIKQINSVNVSQNPSRPENFDIDELIFIVDRPISRSMYGKKRLDRIAFSVAVDILRATYNGNFFVNGAEAAGIISLMGLNKKDLAKFRSYWNDNFKGAKKSHKTAITNADLKYVRMAITNRDLEFSEYGIELRSKIFSAFGMQTIIMSVADGTTGKLNSQEQVDLYKEGALKPLLNKEAEYYTREILHMGLGFRDLMVVFPSVDLLDSQAQSKIDETDLKNAILTVNEVRSKRGLADVPWGDAPVAVMPGGVQIDPDTGRLVQVRTNSSPAANGDKKSFDKYFDSVKIKIFALLSSLDRINYVKCEVKENAKTFKMNVNGEDHILKRYTLPAKFKDCDLSKILDKALDYSYWNFNTTGEEYMKCVSSRIKWEIVFNIMGGTVKRISRQIDRIRTDELIYGLGGADLNANSG